MQLNKISFEKLYWLAALAFAPALFFYYVGEEGSFTASALEMWHTGNFLTPSNYGADNARPPLLYWPIIGAANLFGWQNMLLGSRFVSIGATLLTATMLIRFTARALGDKRLAIFSGLIFLTMLDLSLYRGWLAYADPLFSLFVASAMFALWLAVIEKRVIWLVVAIVSVSCGFLSKALTAYLFYAITLFALVLDKRNRAFLFSPTSIFIHAAMLLVPLLWFFLAPAGSVHGGRMLGEIQYKLSILSFWGYLSHLLSFPLELSVRLLPGSAIVAYLWWRNRSQALFGGDHHLLTAATIFFLNFLPYWLPPQSSIRYLLPLYPVWSLFVGMFIWKCGPHAVELTKKWIIAALVLKIAFMLILFPYYQAHYRGKNYLEAATQIVELTKRYPLYVNDTDASVESVAGYINSLRYPTQPPLSFPPSDFKDGFILKYAPDTAQGDIFKQYQLGGDKLTLLCRGMACTEN